MHLPKRILAGAAQLDDAAIEELYGLEPVYEPGVAAGREASPVEVVVDDSGALAALLPNRMD